MRQDYKAYLKDILEAIRRIEKYTKGLSFDEFAGDELTQDGVVRNLEVIGEAVKNIPEDVKNKKNEVEWRKIAGLRDILIHAYFGVDVDIVWEVVKDKVPELKEKVLEILSEIEGNNK